ncbi:hypothetical protein [Saccharopolyspora indica]|uniref:hypothetical protein n=1 Tax=Saccharopolyspora indica TaxID=1229659 RepID=UPI0022EB80EE|nr:hypothetical protein [Saccharopolyspora indica]
MIRTASSVSVYEVARDDSAHDSTTAAPGPVVAATIPASAPGVAVKVVISGVMAQLSQQSNWISIELLSHDQVINELKISTEGESSSCVVVSVNPMGAVESSATEFPCRYSKSIQIPPRPRTPQQNRNISAEKMSHRTS